MKEHDETLLRTAIQALQTAEPDQGQIANSAKRVAGRLGIAIEDDLLDRPMNDAIENCDDIRQLLGSYRAGTLSGARSLLVEAHLRECGACLRRSRRGGAVVWAVP